MRYNESVHMPKIDFELSSIAYGPEATVKDVIQKWKVKWVVLLGAKISFKSRRKSTQPFRTQNVQPNVRVDYE